MELFALMLALLMNSHWWNLWSWCWPCFLMEPFNSFVVGTANYLHRFGVGTED